MKKVTNLEDEKILRVVESQTGLTRENSNIEEALEECKERNKMYHEFEDAKARKLIKEGKEPYPCCNMVCEHCQQNENTHVTDEGFITFSGRSDFCTIGDSHGCLFQMNNYPPNSLNYEEYMPSHVEALDMLEKHGLLKGNRQRYEEANATYDRVSNSSERHNNEIKGVTFAQIHEIIKYLGEDMPEFFNPDYDNTALAQIVCVEIEKAMGIYPNIRLA